MSSDKLVLLKSRTQRWAEMLIVPVVVLPLGPVLRALFGDNYSLWYGIAAALGLLLLVSMLGSRWSARHGGEWVTEPERLRRLLVEAERTPRWLFALATMVSNALTFFGMILVIEPFDEWNDSWLDAPSRIGFIAAVAALSAIWILFAPRKSNRPAVSDEAAPPGHVRAELRRLVLWNTLAWIIGPAAGLVIATRFDGDIRFAIFALASLAVSTVLRHLFLCYPAPKQLYPKTSGTLGHDLFTGSMVLGLPMGLFLSGMVFLEMPEPALLPDAIVLFGGIRLPLVAAFAVGLGLVLVASVVVGLAFGVFMHLVRRLSDAERSQPE